VYLIQYCVFWAMLRGIPSVLGADRTRGWFDFVPTFRLQIWKNGDHWNFIMQGARYSTNDSHFMVRQLRHRFSTLLAHFSAPHTSRDLLYFYFVSMLIGC